MICALKSTAQILFSRNSLTTSFRSETYPSFQQGINPHQLGSQVLPRVRAALMLKRILNSFGRFVHEEDGPTAVEYAVMLSLIIVVCIASVRSVSNATRDSFDRSSQVLIPAL
jgi:pilus assembly protein Flp/PilA